MPKSWTALAQSDGLYIENDFKSAFYQLVCSQVLYSRETNHAVSYALIAKYKSEFREAADLLGLRLEFNDSLRYCFVVPYLTKHQHILDTTETLLILVMRRIYHDKATTGDLDTGEATITIGELTSTYLASTKRELPKASGELKEYIGRLRRYGIAKLGEPIDDDQPFTVVIQPAITDILSDMTLGRLGAYQQASADSINSEPSDETEDQIDEAP
jgi:hypothetical protein